MQKKIKEIQIGDIVKSWDFDKETVVPSMVLKTWEHKNDKRSYILNDKLTITGSHQVYTKDGFKNTRDIKVGDKLLDSNGKYIRVKSFKLNKLDTPYVYNLTVKVNNYFADGVLVHNTGAGGVWGKAGKWHGSDAVAQSAIDSLTASLSSYTETKKLMADAYAQQTGDLEEKLDLQRQELSSTATKAGVAASQESRKIGKDIAQTGLSGAGGQMQRDLELKRISEATDLHLKGETVAMTSSQEQSALKREMGKEELSMNQGLRGAINSSRAQVLQLDDEWGRSATGGTKNVFRGSRAPETMIQRYQADEEGFSHYCVTPNTKVEMWDSNGDR